MFPKKNRLPGNNFKFKPSSRIITPYFSIKFINNNTNENRFGIIINNKIDKRSTKRHFLKRIFISNLKNWPNISKDFIIIVLSQIKNIPYKNLKNELKNEINLAFKKIK